jgi:hypothetical protein
MTQMFTIPPNIVLILGLAMVLATLGFVVYGFIKGWKNVLKDYMGKKDELTIDG